MPIKGMLLRLIAFAPMTALGAPVQFIADGTMFSSEAMEIDYRFQGLLGDIVDLTDGTHDVRLRSTNEYTFQFSVHVAKGLVSVSDETSEPPNCKQGSSVSWARPTVASPDATHAYYKVEVESPTFGKPTGLTMCAMAEMASCNAQKIILNAVSEPAGSEIWIDGKKADQLTNIILSVPYCSYERSKWIVLRQPGMINCGREVATAPNSQVNLTCKMSPAH
jgi:hypothetical protein